MIDCMRAYRKLALIALIILCLPLLAYSQTGWKMPAHTWGGAGSDYADSAAIDSKGNAYVAGSTASFGAGGSDVLLLKYDPAGNLLWAKTWGGASDEYATSVAIGPDGSIYITGGTSSFGSGWFDFFLLKLDTGGNLQWATTWGGGSYDVGHDIGFDASGNIYVVGETYSFGPCCSSAVLIKFSPSGGSPIWTRTWKGPATYDGAYSLTVDSQGSIIVSGISWDYSVFPHHNSLLLIKYDSAGNFLWSENWNSPIPADDESWSFKALTTDSTGNIYVGGRHTNQCLTDDFSQCDFDAFVMRLDSGGNFLWARTWGGPGYDTPASVAIDSTGHLLVSGIDDAFRTPLLSVLTYDTAGNLLSRTAWSTQAMVPGSAQAGMTLDPLGNVFVVSAASNNSGAWGSIPANATPMTNSLVSNPFSLGSPVGSVALFTNPPTVSQIGAGDTGGGGMDVLVTPLTLSPAPSGTISVSTNNPAATFTITDGATNTFTGSGTAFTQSAPAGTYTIAFGPVAGFVTPVGATGSLAAGGTLNFTGTYVAAPPTIISISPSSGIQGQTMTVTVAGSNFSPSVQLSFSTSEIIVNRSPVITSSQIVASVTISSNTSPGLYDVTVTNSNGQQAKLIGALVVAPILPPSPPGGFLGFPLSKLTSHTAGITSVFDHQVRRDPQSSAPLFYKNDRDGVTVDYKGEEGLEAIGTDNSDCCPSYSNIEKNTNGASKPFTVNGHYRNRTGPDKLSYDGHAGYDFVYNTQTFQQPILAPADGILFIPDQDPITLHASATTAPEVFDIMAIAHGNGFVTWYLHAGCKAGTTDGKKIVCSAHEDYRGLIDKKTGLRVCSIDALRKTGCQVYRGDVIGLAGNMGLTATTSVAHIHFEVRIGLLMGSNGLPSCGVPLCRPVDPYGWLPSPDSPIQIDPYAQYLGGSKSVPLWLQ